MGRRGRSHRFLDHWHKRQLHVADGILTWTLIDNPDHGVAPHVEFGKLTAADGEPRLLHPTEVLALLTEHGHPDAAHVPVETHVGSAFTR